MKSKTPNSLTIPESILFSVYRKASHRLADLDQQFERLFSQSFGRSKGLPRFAQAISKFKRNREYLLRASHPGFYGQLGQSRWIESTDGVPSLAIEGTLFSHHQKIIRLQVAPLGQKLWPAEYGLPKPEFAHTIFQEPHAEHSGFSILLEMPNPSPSTLRLTFEAVLQDGTRVIGIFPPQSLPTSPAPIRIHELDDRFAAERMRHPPAQKIAFAETKHPEISVILSPTKSPSALLRGIESLLLHRDLDAEILLPFDQKDTSHAPQRRWLNQAFGVRAISCPTGGFSQRARTAAQAAHGDWLVFLDADAELVGPSLNFALQQIRDNPKIGAVGGKIIGADGRLQQAGAIVWNDATIKNYGAGGDPFSGSFNFIRNVDLVTRPFFMTPRTLFLELGGFSEQYLPTIREELDYCVKIRKKGLSTLYLPQVTVLTRNPPIEAPPNGDPHPFIAQYRDYFNSKPGRSSLNLEQARHETQPNREILLIAQSSIPGLAEISALDLTHTHLCLCILDPGTLEGMPIESELSGNIEIFVRSDLESIMQIVEQRAPYLESVVFCDAERHFGLAIQMQNRLMRWSQVKVISGLERLKKATPA